MGDKITKSPHIRFAGFTDAWEQCKFGELYKISSGYAFKASDYCENGVPIINGESIQHGKVGSNNLNYLPKKYLHEYSDFILKEGDIVLGLNRPVTNGYLKIAKIPDVFNDSLLYQRAGRVNFLENIDENFTYILLGKEILEHTLKEAVGSDQPFISTSKLDKWKMIIPENEEERKKIGVFFSNVDNLITLHQRKLELLKVTKKSMLQKMFPKDGENVPEIRFAGFTDAWEQRKVKELCSISTGKSNTQDKIDDGEYPFYVRSPIIERSTKYLYDEEAVLTVGDGVGTGKVFHYINGKYDLHQRCYRMFGFSDELNAKYFYHAFSLLFYKRVMAMTAKTSVDSVRYEMIADMKIPVPSISEQEKIGTFFTEVDNLITLHQRELDLLKDLKKSMLQQMFI